MEQSALSKLYEELKKQIKLHLSEKHRRNYLKKLIIIVLIILTLALTACNTEYDQVQINNGRIETIAIYQQIGSVAIIVTGDGIYISNRIEEVEE